MFKSVQRGGTVSGPASLKQSDNVVALLKERADTVADAECHSVPEAPETTVTPAHALATAQAVLSNSLKSQHHLQLRVENIRNNLMIAGEQVPTLDQTNLSMLQEAYINAATAFNVASDKSAIWQQRVAALQLELISHPDRSPDDDRVNRLLAA